MATPLKSSIKAAPGRPFEKGKSGNPGGRRKGPGLKKALTQYIRKYPERLDMAVDTLVTKAIAGDMKAQELLWTRIEGKPTEHVQQVTRQLVRVSDESPDA